jgi:hypothetical protein
MNRETLFQRPKALPTIPRVVQELIASFKNIPGIDARQFWRHRPSPQDMEELSVGLEDLLTP